MYLRVSPFRRFAIYFIDVALLTIISSLLLIGFLKVFNFNTARFDELYDTIYKAYLDFALGRNDNLTSPEMSNNISEFFKLYMIREGIRYAILFVLIFLYFVLLPYFTKWQTLGRLITRSMVINDSGELKPSMPTLIIRELIGTFLLYFLFGGIIGLISALIAIVTERSLVDRMSKTVMVLNEPIPLINKEYQANFFTDKEKNYQYNGDNYRNNEEEKPVNNHDDYIDAEIKDVDDNNDVNNNIDDDDEYKVI